MFHAGTRIPQSQTHVKPTPPAPEESGGSRFTDAEKVFFIHYLQWRMHDDPTVTKDELYEELAEAVSAYMLHQIPFACHSCLLTSCAYAPCDRSHTTTRARGSGIGTSTRNYLIRYSSKDEKVPPRRRARSRGQLLQTLRTAKDPKRTARESQTLRSPSLSLSLRDLIVLVLLLPR